MSESYNIEKHYQATGNKAIDGCASAIMYFRQRRKALAAIWLTEKYFDWYAAGIATISGLRPFDRDGLLAQGTLGIDDDGREYFLMDGVKICQGSKLQVAPILPQQWEPVEN